MIAAAACTLSTPTMAWRRSCDEGQGDKGHGDHLCRHGARGRGGEHSRLPGRELQLYLVLIVLLGVAGLGITLRYQYLVIKKQAEVELTGSEKYRQLAEEFRRLAEATVTPASTLSLHSARSAHSLTTCESRRRRCRKSSGTSSNP